MLANRLKILLAERDLTIKDAMQATNISRSSFSNMINNPYANISTDNVDKLCNFLEVTPSDFYDFSQWRINVNVPENNSEMKLGSAIDLNLTMISGHLKRSNSLTCIIQKKSSDHYEAIFKGSKIGDPFFIDAYKSVSPLFQHEIERKFEHAAATLLQSMIGSSYDIEKIKSKIRKANSTKDLTNLIDSLFLHVTYLLSDSDQPLFDRTHKLTI